MSHSRNANRNWEAPGPAVRTRALPGHASRTTATEQRGASGTARGEGLHPDGAAYRVACRLFPGFADLPAAFRAGLEAYAPLLSADQGPLSLREREAIARAVGGREDGFGSFEDRTLTDDAAASPPTPAADEAATRAAEREGLIASFAVKVTRRWLAIEGRDVERLLDAGVPASGIRAIAETAAVFHFLAEVSSAMRLRPRLTSGGRAPISGVASRDPSWRELSRWLA